MRHLPPAIAALMVLFFIGPTSDVYAPSICQELADKIPLHAAKAIEESPLDTLSTGSDPTIRLVRDPLFTIEASQNDRRQRAAVNAFRRRFSPDRALVESLTASLNELQQHLEMRIFCRRLKWRAAVPRADSRHKLAVSAVSKL